MPSAPYKAGKVTAALEDAKASYAKTNPQSAQIHKDSIATLPGGTTRNVIHFTPFPLILAGGAGAHLTDVDAHRYLDLCGEYSAGLFGHSHPRILAAMHAAIDGGVALGGVNTYEGRVAACFCARFAAMDQIRFSNSGTEAVQTALALVKAYTGRKTILVMKGAYHGGLASFSKASNAMNAPHDWVFAPYNDVEALRAVADAHKDDLACIFLELMQGSAGCIPASKAFVQACRDKATELGAVLMFDEVMTSRMSAGGLQQLVGIAPDMTTLGKYYAGGGQNFGAFGGRRAIMSMLDPGHPRGVYHSGTYNNNVTTMAACACVLEEVWTPAAAEELFARGEWLRGELNAAAKAAGSTLRVSGVGSLMNVHFSADEAVNANGVLDGDVELREVFFFDMLRKGFFIARRGFIALMTVHTKEQLESFVQAVKEWLVERKEIAC